MVLLAGCNQADNTTPATGNQKVQKVDISTASYVGSEACISCHGENVSSNFHQTPHAGMFKPASEYPELNLNQQVTVFDHGNNENPAKTTITLSQADVKGIFNDNSIVVSLDQASGFSGDNLGLYRVASLEKVENAITLQAATLKDYDKDGAKDWGAKTFGDCSTCHSPGLAVQATEANGAKNLAAGISCETCHGPASVHVTTGSKSAIAVNNDACYVCHTGEPSKYPGSNSCSQCHTSHTLNNQGKLFKKDDFSCQSCHGKNFDPKGQDPHHPSSNAHK